MPLKERLKKKQVTKLFVWCKYLFVCVCVTALLFIELHEIGFHICFQILLTDYSKLNLDYFYDPGARISVGDGMLTIIAKNQSVMDKVLEKVFATDLIYRKN